MTGTKNSNVGPREGKRLSELSSWRRRATAWGLSGLTAFIPLVCTREACQGGSVCTATQQCENKIADGQKVISLTTDQTGPEGHGQLARVTATLPEDWEQATVFAFRSDLNDQAVRAKSNVPVGGPGWGANPNGASMGAIVNLHAPTAVTGHLPLLHLLWVLDGTGYQGRLTGTSAQQRYTRAMREGAEWKP